MSKIDTHHHFFPEDDRPSSAEKHPIPGGIPIPRWSRDAALRLMDRFDIGTAILSTPVPSLSDAQWTRQMNETGATLMHAEPDRFGYFATLPLPDVDAALEEIRHAFDDLHVDGVILLANSEGVYLGDARFDPVMAELDRRQAVVFVHPTNLPGPPTSPIPPFAADFVLDTTRAAIQLVMSGTMDRYTRMKIILSHAGGFTPFIAYRILPLLALAMGDINATEQALDKLKLFYFDLALSSSPTALPSLLALAQPTHITYGSDWPAAPDQAVAFFDKNFHQYPFEAHQRDAITRDNAQRLFPRLAGG